MKYRIVIRFGDIVRASKNLPVIRSVVARDDDVVARGGSMIEVLTEHPEKFIAEFFENGFNETFTCQLEIS